MNNKYFSVPRFASMLADHMKFAVERLDGQHCFRYLTKWEFIDYYDKYYVSNWKFDDETDFIIHVHVVS